MNNKITHYALSVVVSEVVAVIIYVLLYLLGAIEFRKVIYFPVENPTIMQWLSKVLFIEYTRGNVAILSILGVLIEFAILGPIALLTWRSIFNDKPGTNRQ